MRRDPLEWGLFIALLVLAVACLFVLPALSHEHDGFKFDPICCNGNNVNGDCQPIPGSAVTHLGNGQLLVTLKPGDHPMVTRIHVYRFEQSKVRWTDNGRNYACLYPDEDKLRCLYLAPFGT